MLERLLKRRHSNEVIFRFSTTLEDRGVSRRIIPLLEDISRSAYERMYCMAGYAYTKG